MATSGVCPFGAIGIPLSKDDNKKYFQICLNVIWGAKLSMSITLPLP
jgi:hypothetical protein